MSSANFAIALDFAGLNVALPDIAEDLGATTGGLQWITIAYLLTLTVFLVPAGRAADRYGRRRLCMGGLVVFTMGSVVSTVAGSPTELAISRGITGIGAAFLMATTLSLVGAAFPWSQGRGRAIGLWTAVGAVGSASGPLFAGILTQAASWRWFFALAVPLALVTLAVLTTGRVPESRGDRGGATLDWIGAALLTLGLGGIVLALLMAPAPGSNEMAVALAAVLGLVGLAGFAVREHTASEPLVDLQSFANVGFVISSAVAFVANVAFAAAMFFIALYLQDVYELGPATSGTILLALTASLVVLSPVAGRLAPRIGVDLVMVIGMVALIMSFVLFAFIGNNQGLPLAILGLLLSGAGQAFAFDGSNLGAISAVPERAIGAASGLVNGVRQAGALLGLAFTGALFRHLAGNEPDDNSFVDGLRPTMLFVAGICAIAAVVALMTRARVDRAAPT
jgi:EmrB/QacA subfamily drug resistance transporter